MQEALQSGLKPEHVLVSDNFQIKEEDEDLVRDADFIPASEYKKVSTLTTPEGILGVFKIPEFPSEFPLPAIFLENVQDPGNMGTIIRNADWFGIPSLICSPDSADPWQPKVVRSSMGSVFRVQIQVRRDFYELLESAEVPVLTADMFGTALNTLTIPESCIMVLGNEGRGITPRVRSIPDIRKIHIPGSGNADSLNVGVASGILAYAWFLANPRILS